MLDKQNPQGKSEKFKSDQKSVEGDIIQKGLSVTKGMKLNEKMI